MSELRIIAERIKRKVGVRDVASRFGFDYRDKGDRARYPCPICRESSSSKQTVSVFTGDDGLEHWNCFSCSVGGDCISWLAARLDCQPYESIRRLAVILGVEVDDDAVLGFLTDSIKNHAVAEFGGARSTLRAVRAEWWKWRASRPEATDDEVIARLPVMELAELRAFRGHDEGLAARVRKILAGPSVPAPGETPGTAALAELFRSYHDLVGEPGGERVEFLKDRVVDAAEYVRERGWTDSDVAPFSVGYCPVGCGAALRDQESLAAVGAVYPVRGKSPRHAMEGRVVFPIRGVSGRVVALAGRTIVDDRAKYLNTRETTVFAKGMVLFGLHENLREIVARRRAYVVEGYADVLAMRRHGSRLAVAAMGTSVTAHHAEILSRVAEEVVVLLDADRAGAEASSRAVDVLRSTRYRLSVATLPPGKDPDDSTPGEIRAALAARRPVERSTRGPGADWLERLLTRS